MRERPILFSGPMVRAILAGNKTQTRRTNGLAYFSSPDNDPDGWCCARVTDGHAYMVYENSPHERAVPCPYGQPGDRILCGGDLLYVRETWAAPHAYDHLPPRMIPRDAPIHYAATEDRGDLLWRPSIHMPRWACRLVLEITRVRVERLQQISDADCWAEGIEEYDGLLDEAEICRLAKAMGRSIEDPQPIFAALWEQINGAGAWDANPWVWVMEFRRTVARQDCKE